MEQQQPDGLTLACLKIPDAMAASTCEKIQTAVKAVVTSLGRLPAGAWQQPGLQGLRPQSPPCLTWLACPSSSCRASSSCHG